MATKNRRGAYRASTVSSACSATTSRSAPSLGTCRGVRLVPTPSNAGSSSSATTAPLNSLAASFKEPHILPRHHRGDLPVPQGQGTDGPLLLGLGHARAVRTHPAASPRGPGGARDRGPAQRRGTRSSPSGRAAGDRRPTRGLRRDLASPVERASGASLRRRGARAGRLRAGPRPRDGRRGGRRGIRLVSVAKHPYRRVRGAHR
jgi:hypothetical protein